MSADRLLLDTKWFQVIARAQGNRDPYYMLTLDDYVSVVAVTPERRVLLVRQFRPVVERETLELPSGHVEAGEAPDAAARRELLEETGYEAPHLDLIGNLVPDVGRLTNRLWCYFARDVRRAPTVHAREAGVHLVELPETEALRAALDGRIDHALNLAALFLALASGKVSLTP